jgi:hypothetical protein
LAILLSWLRHISCLAAFNIVAPTFVIAAANECGIENQSTKYTLLVIGLGCAGTKADAGLD